jgi:hypothetical protein
MNNQIGNSYDALSVHRKLEQIHKAGNKLARLLESMGTKAEKEEAVYQWRELMKQPLNLPEGDTKKSWETWK